uniref:Putative salivary lipocalin n=1 Tax=Panstrongylus megistus TaxID=65343 RepID=A0A069DQ90_9HEMI
MKTIITVIFFGILTYTVAQKPAASSGCKNTLPAKRDLNIQDFFKGSWYVTHIKDGGNEAACREYKFSMKDGLIKLSADGDYTFKKEKKHYTTTCSSVSGSPLNPAGPFVLKCRHHHTVGKEQNNIFFQLDLSVVETDYNNYALVYRCTNYDDKSLNLHYGNLLLLQRNKSGDISKAATTLKQPSLTQFKKTAGC